MPPSQSRPGDPPFLPDRFFLGRGGGFGIDRDPFGRILRRCVIETVGKPHRSRDAICVDETLSYDDGEVQSWRWVLGRGDHGRYLIAESQAGSGHIALQGARGDFVFSFHRSRRLISPRHRTRFTLLSDEFALETTWVSFLGIPRLHFTALRRRGAPAADGRASERTEAIDLGRAASQAAGDDRVLAQVG